MTAIQCFPHEPVVARHPALRGNSNPHHHFGRAMISASCARQHIIAAAIVQELLRQIAPEDQLLRAPTFASMLGKNLSLSAQVTTSLLSASARLPSTWATRRLLQAKASSRSASFHQTSPRCSPVAQLHLERLNGGRAIGKHGENQLLKSIAWDLGWARNKGHSFQSRP